MRQVYTYSRKKTFSSRLNSSCLFSSFTEDYSKNLYCYFYMRANTAAIGTLKNEGYYLSSGTVKIMVEKETIREIMAREELVRERIDKNGKKWTKKYVGGGGHFLNWLEQYREVYGEKNVEIEEIDSRGFSCFEKGNEKMYRIWVKENK